MGNFNRDDNRGGGFRGGDRGGFNRGGDRGGFRGGDRGPVEMHKATCSECAKSCEVPFRPTGEKPVYCSDCFSAKKNAGGDSRPQRREFGGDRGGDRPNFDRRPAGGNDDTKKQLEMINIKLDRLIRAIEKTGENKPAQKNDAPKANFNFPPKKEEVKSAPAKVESVKAPAKKAVVNKVALKKVLKKATPAKKKK